MDQTEPTPDAAPALGPLTEAIDVRPPRPPRDWLWLRLGLVVLGVGLLPYVEAAVDFVQTVRRQQEWVATHQSEWNAGLVGPDYHWIDIPVGWRAAVIVGSLLVVLAGLLLLLVVSARVCWRQVPQAHGRLVGVVLALLTVVLAFGWSVGNVPEVQADAWPPLDYQVTELVLFLGSFALVCLAVVAGVGPLARRPLPRWKPPPGWYADGAGSTLRWWDGETWTHHVR